MANRGLKNAIISSDYIRKEIKKIGLKYIHDMSRASNNAISAFYSDYKPNFYDRVFGLKPIYQIKTNYSNTDKTMTIDFIYSSSFITGHGEKSSIIFNGPFEQGFHGGPIRSGDKEHGYTYSPAHERMNPSPYELIETFYDSYEI